MTLRHRDRSGRLRDRHLEPHGVVAHGGRWYAVGHDRDHAEVRTFRLDRVVSVVVDRATTTSGPRPTDEGAVAAEMVAAMAEAPYRHAVRVLVDAPAGHVRSRLPATVAVVDAVGEDRCRVRIRAERLDWVPALLASVDRPFVVEGPVELRALVADLGDRLRRWAAVVPDVGTVGAMANDHPVPPGFAPWTDGHRPTAFQTAVMAVVGALGPGELATYGEVAEEAGRPAAGQAVANVLRAAPDLPWWRVVPGDGRVYRTHAAVQVPLLEAEGHRVDEHLRVRPGVEDGIRSDTITT